MNHQRKADNRRRLDPHPYASGPAFESLENRLLLDAAPTFEAPLANYYVLTPDGGLTIGVDGSDADGDAVTIDVSFADAGAGLTSSIYDSTDDNSYALMHFVDAAGDPIGDILVQLFDDRSPLAVERFITLSENYIAEDGTIIPADGDYDAFYTDVIVHRIIDDFMLQTGDAADGDGTGGSPLGDFADQFHEDLSFANRGALAMANSGDNTNDSQWFITDVPTPHLDGEHTIFGQVISGWDVYEQMITLETDSGDRPINAPVLASVDILDSSDQDGVITLTTDEALAGPVETTVTLTDAAGNQTSQTITLLPSSGIEFAEIEPVASGIGEVYEVIQVDLPIDYDRPDQLDVSVSSEYDGDGEVTVTLDSPAADGDPYLLHITRPSEYDGETITITVSAEADDVANDTTETFQFDVTLGERPTIEDPGRIDMSPGAELTTPLNIFDGDTDDFTLTIEASRDDVTATIDPDTHEITVTAPADYLGGFSITVEAIETDFLAFSALEPTSQTISFTTLGDRPSITTPETTLYVDAGDTYTFDIDVADDSDVDLTVTLDDMAAVTPAFVSMETIEDNDTGETRYQVTIDMSSLSTSFTASFKVTISAVETDYDDIVTPGTRTFHVVSAAAYDPAILDFVNPGEEVKVATVDGDRLYVGLTDALKIYDLADPAAPVLLGSTPLEYNPSAIEVVDGVAYIATRNNLRLDFGGQYYYYGSPQLLSFDVSDPAAGVTILDSESLSQTCLAIDIEGDLLYLAGGVDGLVIYDLGDAGEINKLLAYAPDTKALTLQSVTSVDVEGDYAYVTDYYAQLVVLNISDPNAIQKVDRIKTNIYGITGTPTDVTVDTDNQKLYVADTSTGLWVYDISSRPDQPRQIGWLGWPSSYVAVQDNMAVLSASVDIGGWHRYVDVSDPTDMAVTRFAFAPGTAGQAVLTDSDLIVVPSGTEGLTLLDGTTLLDSITVTSKRTITVGQGDQAVQTTFAISGGGFLRVHTEDTGEVTHLEVIEGTAKTKVVVTTAGGAPTTIGDVTIYNSIKSFTAKTVTLVGDMLVDGEIAAVTLGGVGGVQRYEQVIRINPNGLVAPKTSVSLTLGAVEDLRILSTMPIKTLAVDEWLDDETPGLGGEGLGEDYTETDAIVAPAVGTLTVKPPKNGPTGDFQADLLLNENGDAPTAVTLGSHFVAGEVTEADWTIYGQAPTVTSGVTGDWTRTVDESLRPTTIYDKRTFTTADGVQVTFAVSGGGVLRVSADDEGFYDFGIVEILNATEKTKVAVTVKGGEATLEDIHADATLASISAPDLTITGDVVIEGALSSLILGDIGVDGAGEQLIQIDGESTFDPKATVALTFGSVRDASLTSAMSIKSLTVTEWLDASDEQTDSIAAPALGVLQTRPPKGGPAGDFQADLTINEDGTAPKNQVVDRVQIAGAIGDVTWTIYGDLGWIRYESAPDAWSAGVDTSLRPTTVYDKHIFTLDNGATALITISGGGVLGVSDGEGGDIGSIEVQNATSRTKVTVKTLDGVFTIGDIHADGSISSIQAAGVTVLGDVIVEGALKSLVLGDVGGDVERREQIIRIDGDGDPKSTVSISLETIEDLRIDSAVAIKTLSAYAWLDNETAWLEGDWLDGAYEEADAVIAPSIASLTIKPPKGQPAGAFQADLDLNADDTATAKTILGKATLTGDIAEADWTVNGDAGTITAGAAAETWQLDVDGSIAAVVTTTGALDGLLSAASFGRLQARTLFSADVLSVASDAGDVCIGKLTADIVDGADIAVSGAIKTVKVGQWTDSDFSGDWIGSLTVAASRHSAATGDFTGNLDEVTSVGKMTIAGDAAGQWDVDNINTLTVKGGLSADILGADEIGKVFVDGDLTGQWSAGAVASLAVGGDVTQLTLTLSEPADAAGKITALGKMTVGGTLADSRILAAGDIGAVTVGAMVNTDLYAGYLAADIDTVVGLPTADQLADEFDALASVKSITVKGLRNEAGEPVASFVASNVAGSSLGTISLVYADTDTGGQAFGVAGHSLKTYKYVDTDHKVSWKATKPDPADGPASIGDLTIRLV